MIALQHLRLDRDQPSDPDKATWSRDEATLKSRQHLAVSLIGAEHQSSNIG